MMGFASLCARGIIPLMFHRQEPRTRRLSSASETLPVGTRERRQKTSRWRQLRALSAISLRRGHVRPMKSAVKTRQQSRLRLSRGLPAWMDVHNNCPPASVCGCCVEISSGRRWGNKQQRLGGTGLIKHIQHTDPAWTGLDQDGPARHSTVAMMTGCHCE